jgi:hypothetical protein
MRSFARRVRARLCAEHHTAGLSRTTSALQIETDLEARVEQTAELIRGEQRDEKDGARIKNESKSRGSGSSYKSEMAKFITSGFNIFARLNTFVTVHSEQLKFQRETFLHGRVR